MQRVLEIGKNEIGYKDNNGKSKYFSELFPDVKTMPWCLPFIEWIFYQAYGKDKAVKMLCMPNDKFIYSVPALVNLFKQKNQWFYSSIYIGGLIFLRANHEWINHVELVVNVQDNNTITIGGNCNGEVKENVYDCNDTRIAGYGRIIYD